MLIALTGYGQDSDRQTSTEPGFDHHLVRPAKFEQTRKQLLELARPMLESLVHEAAGVKVRSMHHDISTVTGEEVIVFSLTDAPGFQ